MKRIAVYCGSSLGTDPSFALQASLLGKTLAQQQIELVYGGAQVGLMGVLADAALHNGGKVIGVLPTFLGSREIAHPNLSQLIMVDDMHQRKTKMAELADGFIAMPGGFGTLEELFEMLTWGQLGLHQKPVAILNVNGYYDDFLSFIQNMVDKGLLKKSNQEMLLVSNNVAQLLALMNTYAPPSIPKWVGVI